MLIENEKRLRSAPGSAESCRAVRGGRGQQQLNSWQTEECLNPVRGIRDWQKRNGIKPHDHHRDNVAAIRAQSTANKLFKHRQELDASKALPPFTPQLSARSSAPSIPTRESKPGSRDFVHENALATKVASVTAKSRRHASKDEEDQQMFSKEDYGQVPTYIHTRRAELARKHAEEQEQKMKDLIPHGMRVMPEEERQEMLEMLRKGIKEVEGKIQALPFVAETISQKQKAAALSKRLEDLEEAMTLFSRPTVLVEL